MKKTDEGARVRVTKGPYEGAEGVVSMAYDKRIGYSSIELAGKRDRIIHIKPSMLKRVKE